MFSGQRYKDYEKPAGKYIFTVEKFLFHCLETFVSISENSFFVWLQFILCLLFAQKQNMTETIAYIKGIIEGSIPILRGQQPSSFNYGAGL